MLEIPADALRTRDQIKMVDFEYELLPYEWNREKHGAKGRELFYWRGHWELNKWMTRLYVERGGEEPFDEDHRWVNEGTLRLTMDDINRLEHDTRAGWIKGRATWENHEVKTLEFCKVARESLRKGNILVYDPSW